MNATGKNVWRLVVSVLVTTAIGPPVQGQQTQAPTATAAANLTSSTGYVCVQRGPNSKLWQRESYLTNSEGDVSTNYQSYNEIGTGICYLPAGSTNYVDTVEGVDAVAGGAQAVQGPHKVQWAVNGYTPTGGSVTITRSDSKQLSCKVFGIAYYDLASGSNAAIAVLQDCRSICRALTRSSTAVLSAT